MLFDVGVEDVLHEVAPKAEVVLLVEVAKDVRLIRE